MLIEDDHLIIQPLAILNTCQTADSKLEVLIQWQGLSPDDTSWEDWNILQTDYRLKDKVILEGMGNDSNTEKLEATKTRPQRKSRAPTYLKDFL